MQTEKGAAVESRKAESKANVAARVKFVVCASLREEYVDADFVHSIFGRIFTRPDDDGDEEDSGCIRASLVQFGEALDRGISTARLGDGIEGNISDYWERLFDLDTGYWKEEIKDEYEISGCDLLIIDCVEIHPRLRGKGIGVSAIDRTIDIFGAGCGLVACKPWTAAIYSGLRP